MELDEPLQLPENIAPGWLQLCCIECDFVGVSVVILLENFVFSKEALELVVLNVFVFV